ncbi:dye-decolorizing peroxidase msp1 [Aspergillus udagawae]|uniref:Dye-decolorizing peroxidase msp1 n=1 Tax=Aspergillus udagawae TaxID=91492 RepID=A0A8H3XR50_9EURO|nr:dye-decolorizing peroxidase msp1 [Aspergillus udagawae]GFF97827.1 dye-decolorizing peroxidase msp1 [Aspergillus udagawae]
MTPERIKKLDLNKDNIQGNIWPGLPKLHEFFLFFNITRETRFRRDLKTLIPLITTANGAFKHHEQIRLNKTEVPSGEEKLEVIPLTGVNIALSAKGLKKLFKDDNDNLKSGNFLGGMLADLQGGVAGGEGRDNPDDWEAKFKPEVEGQYIDGVILVTGRSEQTARAKLREVKQLFIGWFGFSSSIKELFVEYGHVRPDPNSSREHFGYRDLISQPQLEGLDPAPKGNHEPPLVPPGYIITNADQEPVGQPDWATDGSFLVFRKLKQLVPEYNKWLDDTAPEHHLTSDQLSARLMGRWKSGAPVFLTPWEDDPSLADCNNFDFQPGNNQEKCPFAAHIRKCRPRGDVKDQNTFSILRRGIPYGDEVTKEEHDEQTTKNERGMLFLCYQSNIANGFRRVQEQWCNKNTFPPLKRGITGPPGPGADPICGQPNGPDPFVMGLCDGQNDNIHVDLKCCVIPKGGEYFFSPSIKALTNIAKQSAK